VRGSIRDRAPQLFVMTRENSELILQHFGKTLAECTGELGGPLVRRARRRHA
jgi:hypothetical protein